MIENQDIFIDTNILIYSKIKSNPYYQISFNKLYNLFMNNHLYISRQIIRGYLNVMTKPDNLKYLINIKEVTEDIEQFSQNFVVLDEDINTTRDLIILIKQFEPKGRQIHNANIVATMISNNIKNLFTHNEKDSVRYSSLINVIGLG